MKQAHSLNHMFLESVDRYSTKRAALRYRVNGEWIDIGHQELARKVKLVSIGLRERGADVGDRVGILSNNRPEWAIADFACLTGCMISVPIYPSIPPEQIEFILNDSGTTVLFVEDKEQYDKVDEIRESVPTLKTVVLFSGTPEHERDVKFRDLQQQGASAENKYPDYEGKARGVSPDDTATLIYTSGTTGRPKGVVLSHGNFCSNIAASHRVLRSGPDDTSLSFLPLSHSFERMAGHFSMFANGVTINYAESFDTIARDLQETKPTIVTAVPRVYEKIFARVMENALSGSALKRRIFFWARRNAEEWAELKLSGKQVPASLAAKKKIADKLVFSKLQARTGGRIRYFVSGAAPLAPEIAKFFYAAGIPICEGYGLTETSPVISVNPVERIRLGTVGPPIPGVEVRFGDGGEIQVRGPNVMKGYHNMPEETASAIDSDGWFHTGDVGELDEEGYLRITDRLKDIIKTAGGKMIAPQAIENRVKLSKFVANAVVIGDRRPYTIVLVEPEEEAVRKWAEGRNINTGTRETLLANPDVRSHIEREVMLQLRGLASFETPKKVAIIERELSVESGELTPSMKVKRNVIEERCKQLIESTYED